MQKLSYRGNGEINHREASVKNDKYNPLNIMPDNTCQTRYGFDNEEILREYNVLSEEKKEQLLKKTIDEIKNKLNELKWKYVSFSNTGNLISIVYRFIPLFDRLLFAKKLSKILKTIQCYRLELRDSNDLIDHGNLNVYFLVRNSGYIESVSNADKSTSDSDPTEDQTQNNENNADQTENQTQSNKDQTKCRKAIRIPKACLKAWNPDKIRSFIDSEEYESNRKSDKDQTKIKQRSSKDQTTLKTIWLSGEQGRKWNSEKIKLFLHSNLQNEIHNKKHNNYEKGFSILVNTFNAFMESDPEFKEKIIAYGQEHEEEFTELEKEIDKLNGGVNND